MWALTIRSYVAADRGDNEQARRDAYQALSICADQQTRLGLPATLECLARLMVDGGNHADAARLLGAADAIRHRTGEFRFPVFQDIYATALEACRDQLGDDAFQAAWTEGAGLSTDDAITYALRGRGERKRPASGWASLTPAELDVARLVSEGLPNKDIAERLFISPRTVQAHLTHMYTKLDYTSRVQLAQEAVRQNGLL
jgi:DNA-binding CsgD family transcriptional regulator